MGDTSTQNPGELDKIIEEKLNERLEAERKRIEAETEKKYKETIRATKEQVRGELEKEKEERKAREQELADAKIELESLKTTSTVGQDEVAKAKALAEEKDRLLTQAGLS